VRGDEEGGDPARVEECHVHQHDLNPVRPDGATRLLVEAGGEGRCCEAIEVAVHADDHDNAADDMPGTRREVRVFLAELSVHRALVSVHQATDHRLAPTIRTAPLTVEAGRVRTHVTADNSRAPRN